VATDYKQLTENLSRFYDFAGKVVLYVGAGGRQLLSLSIRTKKVLAIDHNVASLRELEANRAAKGKQGSIEVLAASFESVTKVGDVV